MLTGDDLKFMVGRQWLRSSMEGINIKMIKAICVCLHSFGGCNASPPNSELTVCAVLVPTAER